MKNGFFGFGAGSGPFLRAAIVAAGLPLSPPLAALATGEPAELGQSVNGFQDDFSGASRNPYWVAVGSAGDCYQQTNGVLRVTTVGGDSNHLLYMAPGASNGVQEVLARICITGFATGQWCRGGICAGGNSDINDLSFLLNCWSAVSLVFRDNDSDGAPGRHFSLLDDARAWGPQTNIVWSNNAWYWMRLRIDPQADGVNDYFAKAWAADGSTPEPSAWQLKWADSAAPKPLRTGWAGVTATSNDGLSEFLVSYILIKSAGLPLIKVSFSQTVPSVPPLITLPRSLNVSAGANLTFKVAGGVPPPLVIQWLFNGQPLAEATNGALSLTNLTIREAGSYGLSLATAGGIQSYGPWTLSVDPTFTKITTGAVVNDGADSIDGAWGDYDNDGFLDLLVVNYAGAGQTLHHNNGNGTFSKVTSAPLVISAGDSTAAAWADYDNDGLLDLFASNYSDQNNFLFHNQGSGAFLQITNGSIVNDGGLSYGAAWADYDNDGLLDLFVGNNSGEANFLYRGHGDGTFDRVTTGTIAEDRLAGATAGIWGDYSGDGKPDLFVINAGGNNALYRNEGNGQFTRITSGALANESSNGAAWADYDNDGNLDLVTTSGNEIHLFHNNGQGGFKRTVLSNSNQHVVACAWGDYDNDGFLDLFLTDWGGHNNVLYHNNGNGTFSRITSGSLANEGGNAWSAAWGDYDNDGFLDLFVPNRGGTGDFLYRNNGNSNHWLKAKLVGTRSNRSGIGAKVRAKAIIGGREMWQLREISSSGTFGHTTLEANFGLGNATNVETLRIEWPSGIVQEMQGLPANQFLTITEPPILRVGQGITPSGFELILESRGGFNYDVQWSKDLVTWLTLKSLKAVNGSVQVLDTSAKAYEQRFFRAIQR